MLVKMSFLSNLRDRLVGGVPPVDPAARALVSRLADEIRAADAAYTTPPDTFAAGRLLLEASPAERLERTRALLEHRTAFLSGTHTTSEWIVHAIMQATLNRLLRPRQPYTQAELTELVRLAATTVTDWGNWEFPLGSLLGQIPPALGGAPMDAGLAAQLH